MFVRTPRLLLRPGWIEDAPALATAIGEEAIVRNLATAPYPYDLADARSFLALPEHARLPRLLAFARTRGVPRLIGAAGLSRDPHGDIELGYWIGRAHWGLGYATEAAGAVLALGRTLGHRRITSGHFTDNPASGHVLRKLGFRPTGRVVPRRSLARGGAVDCVLYEHAEDDSAGDRPMALAA